MNTLVPRRVLTPFLVGLGLAILGTPAAAQSVPSGNAPGGRPTPVGGSHVDHEGNPLPSEAIARVGSARLRAAGRIHWLAYAPDGKSILSASHRTMSSETAIEFWDAATGKLRHTVPIKGSIHAPGLTFHPDGKILYLDFEGACRALDSRDGKEPWKRKLGAADDFPLFHPPWVCFSPLGSLVAVRKEFEHVSLFELGQGKEKVRPILKAAPRNGGLNISGPTLAFTPDGAMLAVASEANRIEVFDVADGKRRFEFEAPLKEVHHIEISPDGRHLFCTGHKQERVVLRDWASKKEIVRLGPATANTVCAFSPDGRHLGVADSKGYDSLDSKEYVTLYEVATGKEVRRFPTGPDCTRLAFSADGRTLLTGNSRGAIGQWDVETGKLLPASADPLCAVRVMRSSWGGKHLIAYANRHVLFDWQSGRAVRACAEAESEDLRYPLLSPDGTLLAVYEAKEVRLLDAQTGKEVRRLGVAGGYVGRLVFAGKTLLTVVSDKVVRVWDLDKLKPVRELKDPGPAMMLAASPDGRHFAAAADGNMVTTDRDVRIWDVPSGNLLQRFTPRRGAAHLLTFSPSGHALAILANEPHRSWEGSEVILVDMRTGSEKRLTAVLDKGAVQLVFSPDGRTLATADGYGGMRLWEVATGQERHRFEGHKNLIEGVAFSDDGALLASSSSEAPAYVWDIYGKHAKEQPPPEKWSAEDGARLWRELASPDAKAAFRTVRRLIRNSGPAIALVGQRLKPAEALDAKRVKQWLRDLDSDDFEVRREAFAELDGLGDRVESPLKQAISGPISLEGKRRVQSLLDKLDAPTAERLARWRALEALEQIATPEAVRLLEALASGEPGAELTRDAASTLDRLKAKAK